MDGVIPPAKNGAIISVKRISVGLKRMVMTIHETESSITIYIGNAKIYCVDVQLLKKVNGKFYDTGNLNKIRWDKVCSLNDDFKRGTDSVMLLKLVISYIHLKYPEVKHLRFTDLSTKECDDGSSINLAALKFLTVGKTWYEDNFGASIDEQSEMFYKTLLKQILEKKKSWETIKTVIPVSKLSLPEEYLENLYNKAETWQEFFNPILDKLGRVRTCILFSPWFNSFVLGYLRMSYISLQYSLPVKDHGIDYVIGEHRGGRTRKFK